MHYVDAPAPVLKISSLQLDVALKLPLHCPGGRRSCQSADLRCAVPQAHMQLTDFQQVRTRYVSLRGDVCFPLSRTAYTGAYASELQGRQAAMFLCTGTKAHTHGAFRGAASAAVLITESITPYTQLCSEMKALP